ncbi:LapA family protein [Desertibacillus haloalkaliphilus]|uniref:LapA family protein n=1 Tax=Desertibacillus haloalkaliphilus TaxID=1328930 RepID=UPI001C260419|nr:lipopolysaccharide assembly LapA domain-containing protein [Desertibacillus haloalkaliphilus]MBU8905510.1 DUF1049 domain-containing protein [Desertibacillus haloalkaliphilus]
MRGQWSLILGLIAALVIAVFAVINVDAVRVNYVFGTAEWPLILVIIGSVLMGGVIVGSVGLVKVYQLQQEIKRLNTKLAKTTMNNKPETANSKKPQQEKQTEEKMANKSANKNEAKE